MSRMSPPSSSISSSSISSLSSLFLFSHPLNVSFLALFNVSPLQSLKTSKLQRTAGGGTDGVSDGALDGAAAGADVDVDVETMASMD